MDIDVLAPAADQLGEGAVWLPASEQLLRIDIAEPAIVLRDVATARERHSPPSPRPTGCRTGCASMPKAGSGSRRPARCCGCGRACAGVFG